MRRGLVVPRRRAAAALGIALWLSATGCGQGADEGTRVSQTANPIMGGVLSDDSSDSVVWLLSLDPDGPGSCTGALVAPNMILTARHCVAALDERSHYCNSDGTLDTDRSIGGQMGATFAPESISVLVGVEPVAVEGISVIEIASPYATTVCSGDIALLVLDGELAGVPVLPLRLRTPTRVGEAMTMTGYGINERHVIERRERRGEEIAGVGPSALAPSAGTSRPKTLRLGDGPCKGDSGGPLLSEATGAVVGVCSALVGDCGAASTETFYTQVAAFESLIVDTFARYGQVPLVEEGEAPYALGQAGAAGASAAGAESSSAGSSTAGSGSGSEGRDRSGSVGGCSVSAQSRPWRGLAPWSVAAFLLAVGARRATRGRRSCGSWAPH